MWDDMNEGELQVVPFRNIKSSCFMLYLGGQRAQW